MEPNILNIEFHKDAHKEDALRLNASLTGNKIKFKHISAFPTPIFSITIDTNETALKVRGILQALKEGKWSISGPICPFHPQTMDSVSIGWRCFWKGCDNLRCFSEDPTMSARQFFEKCRLARPTNTIQSSLEKPFVPMNHVVPSYFEREVVGKWVGTKSSPFEKAMDQAEEIRIKHELREMVKPIPSDWEVAERIQKQESQNKELKSTADKLVRVVAGLNLQDQSISTQREVREALTAMMKVLKDGQELR